MAYAKVQITRRRVGREEDNSQPLVTMRGNGSIHFNTNAYEQMGEPEFVTLLYDEDTGNFAIQPVEEKASGEYVLTVRQPNERQSGYDISSTAFALQVGLITQDGETPNQVRRFPAQWNSSEELLEVLVHEAMPVAQRKPRAVGRRRRELQEQAAQAAESEELVPA